jgi:DNA-binding MarR family transcriptional regulator
MDAYLTDDSARSSFDLPPVLIAGSNDRARQRGIRTVEAGGLRIADSVSVDAAAERIDRQAAASALWLELEDCESAELEQLLERVRDDVGEGRYGAVVAAPASLLDRIFAGTGDADVEILIDADDSQRQAALALVTSRARSPQSLSDVAADRNAARLRQLSDEVSRIASTLARLSTGPQPTARAEPQHDVGDLPELSADTVRTVIRARRLRSRFFSEELFADPAWDMLLDLLQAEISQLRVPVSSLCIAAAVPATTALRWLKTMTAQGLFVRRADPHDGRRVFVELAPKASQALRRYFAEVGSPAVI